MFEQIKMREGVNLTFISAILFAVAFLVSGFFMATGTAFAADASSLGLTSVPVEYDRAATQTKFRIVNNSGVEIPYTYRVAGSDINASGTVTADHTMDARFTNPYYFYVNVPHPATVIISWGENNEFSATKASGGAILPAPVCTMNCYVNTVTGSDSNGGASADDAKKTIQAAITQVSDGGTVTVAAGTYVEHVAVNKALTLNGANVDINATSTRAAESIVDGTDTGTPFSITADNVTIDGFTVTNGSNGDFLSGIWSQSGTQNSSIINNIITQNAVGIWAQCGGNCLIQANLFDGNNKTGPSGGAAISADSTTGLTINNNEFKNHTENNPILLQGGGSGHANVVVTGNSMHDNAYTNIALYGVNVGTITGNTIIPASDSTGIGFEGGNSTVQVTGNTITNGAKGVRIEDLYEIGYNSNITINRNSLASDSEYGAGNLGGYDGSVDATCNWWGAASGPSLVGLGSGSPVTTLVDFTSWLTSTDLNGACNGPLPTFTLTYTAGANGTITGVTSQTVGSGLNGTAVTAVANSGFHFTSWSDNSTANPRTDSAVSDDISVTASFAADVVTHGNTYGSRAHRATPAIPAVPGETPAFPAIPSANSNRTVAGVLFTFMRDLGLGDQGADVTELQNRLTREGVYTGPITGYFGPLTFAGVQAYQRKMGIIDTGFVGPLTRGALNHGDTLDTLRLELLELLKQLLAQLQAQLQAQLNAQ